MNNESGIYCIHNKLTNKKYIGQSKTINKRLKVHQRLLKKNKHYNSHLQFAWNKDGENNFEFYVIEYCDESALDDKEKYYIDKYNTTINKNGYNRKKVVKTEALLIPKNLVKK